MLEKTKKLLRRRFIGVDFGVDVGGSRMDSARSSCLVLVLPQAPDADDVTRAACDLLHLEISSTRADRHTINVCLNLGVEVGDVARQLYENTGGVGVVTGGGDCHSLHFHILAAVDDDVEHLSFYRYFGDFPTVPVAIDRGSSRQLASWRRLKTLELKAMATAGASVSGD
ncbi:hypothetical protein F3Y22_tig00111582pilonHSYRG00365 [Hibiscus syriacus]|uniref:Uncharacterized protein n=1 Tax=Hibiscus syriacus TaxID=106335 RepID=A0A6A2Y603_HIBSY|nr:hypothetical protein F3Y22_tig00111582pilonHSYRG00365 [Hibiscus syriacus]